MPSNDSNQDNEIITENDDVSLDIAASIEKLKAEPQESVEEPIEAEKPVAETAEQETEKPKSKYTPPQGYTAAVKEKWELLPEEVQAELVKREDDFHKMVTSRDGELNLGRAIKEVVAPYMADIQAEGGTPITAVRDLLNTAHVLRRGSQQQKQEVIRNVIQAYGIDMNGVVNEPEYIDPTIKSLQQQLAEFKDAVNPDKLISRLTEQQEKAKLQAEAEAFARNPEHKYFDKVRSLMVTLLGEGVAKDFKEAYDMACNAHTEVRSILKAEEESAKQEKRKAEIKAKQNAASSITGSPATAVSNANSPNDDIESAVRAAMRSASGKI